MLEWVALLQAFIDLLEQYHILESLIQLNQLKYEEVNCKTIGI